MSRYIRLLCFDLDDTLWPSAPVLQHAERILFGWLQENAPALCRQYDSQRMREHRLQLLQEHPELQHEISRWRLESLRSVLAETGHSDADTLAEQAFAVFLEARHHVDYFEGVTEVLAQLERDYVIAGVTNGNADVYKLSVGQHFQHALRAEQLKASKPDPALFMALLEKANLSPEQAIYIGDHPVNDVAAARELGMHAIHACLLPEQESIGNVPAFRHWRELPALIESLSASL